MMLKRIAIACIAGLYVGAPANAAEIIIGNWNIQTLTYPGHTKTVFPDDYHRDNSDYADLRQWHDTVGSDVIFLQEVASQAALDAAFPVAEGWQHCINGQYAEAENLPVRPVCTFARMAPAKPTTDGRVPYPAVAMRPNSHLTLITDEALL